ncbi:MAG: transcription antitermination factor NusB, partial [Bacillota bacterium]|nr:transcription antitermination factor NusB [Bacillota bacterium]
MNYNNISSGRELSIHILLEIINKDGFANIAMDSFLNKSKLSKAERSFTTQLVYGCMRHYNTLNWILEQFVGLKIKKIKPVIKVILLSGIYQLIYLDKVPDSAVCNEASKLARKYGHQGIVGFVNGVLRNVARQKDNISYPAADSEPVNHIAIKYSHPHWLVSRWLERYGFDSTVKLCKKNNNPAPVWLRCNTLKINPIDLFDKLTKAGIAAQRSQYAPEGISVHNFDTISSLPGYDEGEFTVQDESSMVVAHILRPNAGAQVIDACSAP